jgi:hypothetical protein
LEPSPTTTPCALRTIVTCVPVGVVVVETILLDDIGSTLLELTEPPPLLDLLLELPEETVIVRVLLAFALAALSACACALDCPETILTAITNHNVKTSLYMLCY